MCTVYSNEHTTSLGMWSELIVWWNTSKLVPVSSTTTTSLRWRCPLEASKCQVQIRSQMPFCLFVHHFNNILWYGIIIKTQRQVIRAPPFFPFVISTFTRHWPRERPGDGGILLPAQDGVCGDGRRGQPLLGGAHTGGCSCGGDLDDM